MCIINAENKSKACWQGIKEERTAVTRSTSIGITLQDNWRSAEGPVEVVNTFNHFFASIAEKTLKVISQTH